MKDYDLDHIWSRSSAVCIDSSLPDDLLVSLSRIHLSFHTLFACMHSDNSSRKDTPVLQRMERLFDECLRRCRETKSPDKLGKLLPWLYLLGKPEYVPLDMSRLGKCDRVADKALRAWMREDSLPWEALHGILRTVAELACDLGKTERQRDPVFQKYARILDGWMHETSADNTWKNISEREAWSRLEVLGRNSSLLPDDTYDGQMLLIRNSYRQKIGLTEQPVELLSLLLAAEQSIGASDAETMEYIQKEAAGHISRDIPDENGYWAALSVATGCICMKHTGCYFPQTELSFV